jgi:hypothetical protein
MKTFSELMEQIGVVDQTKVALAKTKATSTAARLRNRRLEQQRLHTTMHLNQTAEKEDRKKNAAYNA